MNNDPLAQLKPLKTEHLDSFIWWPLAPGWWILIACVFIFLALLWWFFKRKKQTSDSSVTNLQHAEVLYIEYKEDNNARAYIERVNQLLRRVCIQRYGRPTVSALSGLEWIAFLNKQSHQFNEPHAQLLAHSAYHQQALDDAPIHELHKLVNAWLINSEKNQ